jgi:hypothetical protein
MGKNTESPRHETLRDITQEILRPIYKKNVTDKIRSEDIR